MSDVRAHAQTMFFRRVGPNVKRPNDRLARNFCWQDQPPNRCTSMPSTAHQVDHSALVNTPFMATLYDGCCGKIDFSVGVVVWCQQWEIGSKLVFCWHRECRSSRAPFEASAQWIFVMKAVTSMKDSIKNCLRLFVLLLQSVSCVIIPVHCNENFGRHFWHVTITCRCILEVIDSNQFQNHRSLYILSTDRLLSKHVELLAFGDHFGQQQWPWYGKSIFVVMAPIPMPLTCFQVKYTNNSCCCFELKNTKGHGGAIYALWDAFVVKILWLESRNLVLGRVTVQVWCRLMD